MSPQSNYLLVAVFALLTPCLRSSHVGTEPVLSGRPFVTVWNAPTRRCWDTFGVELDLAAFDITINQNHSFIGGEVVIFYSNQLGLYPFYDSGVESVNGGLPQKASLDDHLRKAHNDLVEAIIDPLFKGVAVVDWENWRPVWSRNWDKMKVYIQQSLQWVRQRYPYWSHRRVRRLARNEFEGAAQDFMRSTLELGRTLRPGGLWGFYGFPSCYNYNYRNTSHNYTGVCPEVEMRRNDRLRWLWGASQALYPEIYLEEWLRNSEYVGRFVRHRVGEGFRVAEVAPGVELPVLPYARIVYTYSMNFLTQEDLIQTIGQSAALGATGIILWGNSDYSRSKESCLAVKTYVDTILGQYVVNVTSGAVLCSQAVCSGNGRCVRKDLTSDVHLHLHPTSFQIEKNLQTKGFVVSGRVTKQDITYLETHFQCRCYPGWTGAECTEKKGS
ncbi:hyaluronidase-1-like isoform 1-T3 [Discoglossus pictus]